MNKIKGVISTGFFRTGSTFFFSCMRKIEAFKCYYEPYHPDILSYVENVQAGLGGPSKADLGHTLDGEYFSEYISVDIHAMRKAFAIERRASNHPIIHEGGSTEDLKGYIDLLINDAKSQGKIPLLQANRFNFCLPWLREQYPDYLLVLITRDPFGVFLSLQSLARKEGKCLEVETSSSNYWNVRECFLGLCAAHAIPAILISAFNYYQQVYFIIRYSEQLMAMSADFVISHEYADLSINALLTAIESTLGYSVSNAVEYCESNYRKGAAHIREPSIVGMEEQVDKVLRLINLYN